MAYKRKSTEEKQVEMEKISQQLREQVRKYYEHPDNIQEFIQFSRQFYNYSVNNRILIQMQLPTAGFVASFNEWKKKGYQVNKGQKGLKIFVPVLKRMFERKPKDWVPVYEATAEEKRKIKAKQLPVREKYSGSKIGYVFDISQTNVPIEDYPTLIKRHVISNNTDNFDHYITGAKEYATAKNVPIRDAHIEGLANGYYTPSTHSITMSEKLDSYNYFSVLIHELAHSQLHRKETKLSKEAKEVQAETTAAIVLSFYGHELSESTLAYIQSYGKTMDEEQQFELMKQTLDVALDITQTIDGHLMILEEQQTANIA